MPKRTNVFQELVAVIHSKLGTGWQVTESMLLRDAITGELREVDVVAMAKVANYDLYISIECRDQSRRADVNWIEAMAKKHESLPTSKLILWSRSGFTKPAIAKAAALKIDCVSQVAVATTDWATLARSLIGARVKLIKPGFSPFIDVQGLNGEALRLENVRDSLIYDSSGNEVQSVPAILSFLANSPTVRTCLLDHAPIGSGDFYAEVRPPVPWFVEAQDRTLVPIIRVGVGVSTQLEELGLRTASAAFDGKVATLALADSADGKFQLYIEEEPGRPTTVNATVRIRKEI